MCIFLKFDYTKFGVSNLFFRKVIEENLWRGRLDSPPPPQLVKEGLIAFSPHYKSQHIALLNIAHTFLRDEFWGQFFTRKGGLNLFLCVMS